MCMTDGAPKKPKYGACQETHGRNNYVVNPITCYNYNGGTANDSTGTATFYFYNSTATTSASMSWSIY